MEQAGRRDAEDALARFRDEFVLPDAPRGGPAVYLCGNSLGCLPRRASRRVQEVMAEWGRLAVHGHFEASVPWYDYHAPLAEPLGRLVGAAGPDEVVAMNSLTTNLHLLMISLYRPAGRRRKIIIESGAFPSDRYAVASQIALRGGDASDLVELSPRPGETLLREEDLEAILERQGEEIALVLLPGVQYLTGQLLDLERCVSAAHGAGAVAGIDLAHAVGNVPLELHRWGADFAVWCSYKYLNAGPGAPGGCFVHRRHGSGTLQRLAGWWGNDPATRFEMPQAFVPRHGADGWQLSNPPVLAMASLAASLEIFEAAGLEALRRKSLALTAFLEECLDAVPGIDIITPRDARRRGCQLSLRLQQGGARALQGRLSARGVVCDFREPDILRLAPVPLYNRFADVVTAAEHLQEQIASS